MRFRLHLDLESIPDRAILDLEPIPGLEILDLEPDLCPGILDSSAPPWFQVELCQLRDLSVRSHDVLWLFLGLEGTRDPSVGVQFPFSTPPGLAGVVGS